MGSSEFTGTPKWSAFFFLPNLPFPVSSSQSVAIPFDQWLKPKNSSHLWFLPFLHVHPVVHHRFHSFYTQKTPKALCFSPSVSILVQATTFSFPGDHKTLDFLLLLFPLQSTLIPTASVSLCPPSAPTLWWPPTALRTKHIFFTMTWNDREWPVFPNSPYRLPIPLTGLPSVLSPPVGLCLPLAFHSTGSF